MAAPADLPDLRPRRLLRRLAGPPRDRAPSRHVASDHSLTRARRGLVLVLRRRGHFRPRRPARHDADPAFAAGLGELARVDGLANRAADDVVRAAVVELPGERKHVSDVGGSDEALARNLLEALRA